MAAKYDPITGERIFKDYKAKKRMVRKKKRSPAQIAAAKKLVAFNKKRRTKKNPAKKKKARKKKTRKTSTSRTKSSGRMSQVTKRAPSTRLKKRRAKKKVKGYFPNPRGTHIVKLTQKSEPSNIGYYVGDGKFRTEKSKAKSMSQKEAAFTRDMLSHHAQYAEWRISAVKK